ncbi:YbdD/YjiX family protein [Pseudomonas aeruginosa]|uniref:YbdD/YjiX family protein n=1 Tax=Pseudomonas aeruginosa TaxID=287 RepID=UPI0029BFB5C2|nr:YbdD/YjiX family protein [Pseudomonas aeruginosa]
MFNDLSRMGKYLGQAARMLVGMPDYDTYVEHMRNKHPDKPVMTYEEFFRERLVARSGGGLGRPIRCC